MENRERAEGNDNSPGITAGLDPSDSSGFLPTLELAAPFLCV